MIYHVARGTQQLGTRTVEEMRTGLSDGTLLESDLVWSEGMVDWQPLSMVIPNNSAPNIATTLPPQMQRSATGLPPALAGLETKTSRAAIWSLILGISSMICSGISGIPAIILGIVATKNINKSGGVLGGRGLAIAGIICGSALSTVVGFPLLAGRIIPAFTSVHQNARMTHASNNARAIILALKAYAAEHQGKYPDADPSEPQTSNDVFRILIQGGYVNDERIFGSPASPFVPDGDIGSAPKFAKALEAGECHWCLTKGVTESSPNTAPLVFENAVATAWPPAWNCDVAGQPVEGRAWKAGKIIIGFNDGSVGPQKLESSKGVDIGLEKDKSGLDLFMRFQDQGEFLDVLRY